MLCRSESIYFVLISFASVQIFIRRGRVSPPFQGESLGIFSQFPWRRYLLTRAAFAARTCPTQHFPSTREASKRAEMFRAWKLEDSIAFLFSPGAQSSLIRLLLNKSIPLRDSALRLFYSHADEIRIKRTSRPIFTSSRSYPFSSSVTSTRVLESRSKM